MGTWSALIDNYERGHMFVTNDTRGKQRPLASGVSYEDAVLITESHNDRDAVLDVVEMAEAVRAAWEDTVYLNDRDLVSAVGPKVTVGLATALDTLFKRWAG